MPKSRSVLCKDFTIASLFTLLICDTVKFIAIHCKKRTIEYELIPSAMQLRQARVAIARLFVE